MRESSLIARTLSLTTDASSEEPVELARDLLKDQVTKLLRDYIITGRIPQGTKLVEREVAERLGISRAPARDALIQLEKEGLVISKPNARYVIEVTERDIRELYQLRLLLEQLAVELAVKNNTPENCAVLSASLQEMESAVARQDRQAFVKSDVEMHRLLWQQTNNHHLQKMLSSMFGPIFMFVATNAENFDWTMTLEIHTELINAINAGDLPAALVSIERHMDSARSRSLAAFTGKEASSEKAP